jgi:ElaB/YqjD/DUF883 family membrane-anchored ribosome-binding protein
MVRCAARAQLIGIKGRGMAPGILKAAFYLIAMEIEMNVTTDKLMQELKAVVGDTEELLKATSSQGGDQIARIRTRAEESLRTARARMKDITQAAEAQALEAAREVDKQVHDNPWTAIGVAAGLGLAVGLMLRRE